MLMGASRNPEVFFRAEVRETGVTKALVSSLVQRAWKLYEGPEDVVVEVVLLASKEHTALHEEFLGDSDETDVMAFPYQDDDLFGEILINLDFAKKEAKSRKSSVLEEIRLYIAHGALHLLGFDDSNSLSREKMRCAEQRVLAN